VATAQLCLYAILCNVKPEKSATSLQYSMRYIYIWLERKFHKLCKRSRMFLYVHYQRSFEEKPCAHTFFTPAGVIFFSTLCFKNPLDRNKMKLGKDVWLWEQYVHQI
jgi:hypothetical protein